MLSVVEMYLLKKIQDVPEVSVPSLFGSPWDMSKASLYTHLQKLELQGLVTFTTLNTSRLHTPQRRYSLSEKWKNVFRIALELEKALAA